jgi:SHS family sialic acid transporter-like MFS transporter
MTETRPLPQNRGPILALVAAFLGWMFDGMEMGIFPLVGRPALQEMQQVRGVLGEGFLQSWMGIITALFLLGAACGGLVFGWLGDRIGRVKAMTWSILCYSGFTGLCYFAVEPWHLGALRFIAALGMGGEWALGVALVMECWPESRRPLMAGLIGAAANFGYCFIAVIGIAFPIARDSWRWVMLVGAAPAALTFFILRFVPESEKWKASASKAGRSPVREVFSPGLRKNTVLAIAFAGVALIATWGIVQWIPFWADQLTGGTRTAIKAWSQFYQSLGAIVGCYLAAWVGGAFGRRRTYFFLCVASLGVCQWLFRGFNAVGPGFFCVVFLVGLCTASFYGWLPLYLPELFPTRVRATGQGVAFNSGRILAALGAWQSPAVMAFFDNSYPKAGETIVLIYLVGMALIWWAPETKGRPLPE